MPSYQLLGRGTYGPYVAMGPGISPLWQYFQSPPAQNSVIIYNDGTVVERATFENDDITAPDVHTFIYGGTRYRTSLNSFEYNALTAAGYTFEEIPDPDTYTSNYGSNY